MFRGPKPEAQPRSLRSIAESKVDPANVRAQAPSPNDAPYEDRAQAASTARVADAGRPSSTSADKTPFRNVR